MKSWKKDFVTYFNFKTPTVMKCYLNVKILCFITKWIHQYSPSFTIKNLSAGSLVFLISSSMSGLLAAASISSLHTFLHHVRIALELIFFCPLGFPCLPLQHRLSRHLLRTIFLRRWRHRSLHSPHTKYLTLYSFPFTGGSSSIVLPRALWDIVALYCFWCSQTIWSHIERIPPSLFLWLCDIALSLNYSTSNSPLPTAVEKRPRHQIFVGWFLNVWLSYSQGQKLNKLPKVFLCFVPL